MNDDKNVYFVSTEAMKSAKLKIPKPYFVDLDAVKTVDDVKQLLCVLVAAMSGAADPTKAPCLYLFEEYAEDVHFLKSKEQKEKEALVELLKKAQEDVELGRTFSLEQTLEKLNSARKEI